MTQIGCHNCRIKSYCEEADEEHETNEEVGQVLDPSCYDFFCFQFRFESPRTRIQTAQCFSESKWQHTSRPTHNGCPVRDAALSHGTRPHV